MARSGSRRAIVVGGSLGGLCAANWLRDAGFAVEVLERSPHPLEDRGAGIVLHRATVRYLVECRGVDLDSVSLRVSRLRYLDRDGGIVAEAPSGLRFAAYGALYRELLAAFGSDHYRFGCEVVSVYDGGGYAEAVLANGSVARADLIVCADGIRSSSRRGFLPELKAVFAGYVAWRGVAAMASLSPAAADVLGDAITYTIMEQSHLLTYPIAGSADRLMNWVWYHNVASSDELEELLTDSHGRVHDLSLPAGSVPHERVAALRAKARDGLHDVVVETIEKTPEPFVQVLQDVEPPRLAFGRVCLLGDAGFVARPHAAAGTAKACEDAWHLATALTGERDVGRALARWEPAALELGRTLVRRSREAGVRSQFDGTWPVGDPLPFGLYEAGDSEF